MSDSPVRIGFVSADHLHFPGLLRQAIEAPNIEVVGMVIDDAEHRAFIASRFPDVRVFDTPGDLYDTAHPEAIITNRNNRDALHDVEDAARRGIHVMKEKPMAASLTIAEAMQSACARGGVRLMINWPTNWSRAFHHAHAIAASGRIGKVWQVHVRNGHQGPPADFAKNDPIGRIGWEWLMDRDRNGGGAAIDFCSYGAVISRWFMGQPARVTGVGGRYVRTHMTVEDNAVMILQYAHGHSIAEGTWSQPATPSPAPITIYGSEGTIAIPPRQDTEVAVAMGNGPWRQVVETVTAPELPAHFTSGPAYFAHCLRHDLPFEGIVDATLSRDAQEILQAGMQSMATGAAVSLPLPVYLAGRRRQHHRHRA
jgi:predicted dehydrogenase